MPSLYTRLGTPFDRDFNLSYVGVKVVFRVPCPWIVGVDEQKQEALERPALGVHPNGEVGVRASCDGNHPFTHDEVVRELLATSIGAHRLFSQSLTSNDLVFKLDVFQLVPELGGVRAFYHLACWCQG